jgi:hypothetical protein
MPKPTTKNRQDLRSRFVRNAIPSEADFADLIAASLNQADDGLLKLPDQPIGLVRQKQDQPVLRFFADPAADGAVWQVQLGSGDKPSFGLAAADGKPALVVDGEGRVGVGTDTLAAKLHIVHVNQEPSGGTLILGPLGQSHLRMGYNQGYSWIQSHGSKPLTINAIGNNVGIGAATPASKLQVTGTASITSLDGKNYACMNGYMAPGSLTIGGIDSNFGGGTGWNGNTAGLLLETLDNTEIAIHDSGLRLASFMHYESSANRFTIGRDMGWGPIASVDILGNTSIRGQTNILTDTSPIRFSSSWTAFPDNKLNGAEICNDSTGYKTLMIVGNKSNGGGRRVSIWDILEVNGTLKVVGCMTPSAGNSEGNGIMFPKDPAGGGGDAAWIRYYPHSGEACVLEIGISNDPDDYIHLKSSGGVRVNNVVCTSDLQSKENVEDLQSALEKTLKLRGVSYMWKQSDALPGKPRQSKIGLIAQEVRDIFPGLVSSGPGNLLGIDYISLIPVLVESIKSQQSQINRLEHLLASAVNPQIENKSS